jgi:hypothetical protein
MMLMQAMDSIDHYYYYHYYYLPTYLPLLQTATDTLTRYW